MKDMILGEGIARQELNLIFVVDTSGSMSGEKIGAGAAAPCGTCAGAAALCKTPLSCTKRLWPLATCQ